MSRQLPMVLPCAPAVVAEVRGFVEMTNRNQRFESHEDMHELLRRLKNGEHLPAKET